MIVLWTAAAYLHKINKSHWMATIPAVFMTAVSITYILVAPEGFKLNPSIGYPIGIVVALVVLALFLKKTASKKSNLSIAE